jgi:hypothetical protein
LNKKLKYSNSCSSSPSLKDRDSHDTTAQDDPETITITLARTCIWLFNPCDTRVAAALITRGLNHPLWRRLLNDGLLTAVRRRQIGPARDIKYCQRPQAQPRHPPCYFFALAGHQNNELSYRVIHTLHVYCECHGTRNPRREFQLSRLQFLLILRVVVTVGLRME